MDQALPPYPAQLNVVPFDHPAMGSVAVPGSKSITNRALVLAALSDQPCRLQRPLHSEDTAVMIASLRRLGIGIEECPDGDLRVLPAGAPQRIPSTEADLYVANSGTTMRFLTALLCLGRGRFRLDGVPRMRERPIGDLLDALSALGVRVRSEAGNGCPPVLLDADGLPGGQVRIKGDVSSQFLSGLLMAAPFARADLTLVVEGPLVSRPYVDMTVRMLHQWRLRASEPVEGRFEIPGGQRSAGPSAGDDNRDPNGCYRIEPDASGASYCFAAAAITGGRVSVAGLTRHSLQGDVHFVDVLARMGCRVEYGPQEITLQGGPLSGIDVGMSDISDTVMTLAAVACFARGPTTIRNVAHVRHKETDRLAALAAELRKLGAGIEEFADGLTIVPAPLHGAHVDTYQDHRLAMSLALIGLRVPGVVVNDPGCVAKTYPHFFADLESLRC
jgi:3-phosphoshikimate 1-carboxyvinyltransferase